MFCIMKRVILSKDIVLKSVKENLYKKDVCKDLNVCIRTLNQMLNLYRIDFDKECMHKKTELFLRYPHIDREWFIKNWVETHKSLSELSVEFGVPLSTLEFRASHYEITKKYKYQCDTDKLFNMGDCNVYCLAGLIATDGYFPIKSDAFEITLVGDSERELLDKIREYFSVTSSLYIRGNKSTLRVSTDGIKDFFSKNFNIATFDKTHALVGLPFIDNEEMAKAYILGCMDGDGSVGKNRMRFSITTFSEDFITNIRNIIYYHTGVMLNVTYNNVRGRRYPTISSSGSKAMTILSWMYSSKTDFRLDRKYNNFIRLMI